MKLPSVYPLTIPSSHSTMRMIAIVSSIVFSLLAKLGDARNQLISQQRLCRILVAKESTVARARLLVFFLIVAAASPSEAQENDPAQPTNQASTEKQFLPFVAGAATGFVAHEMGHVIADLAFGETPGLKRVDFHGIPFFAITHRSGRSANEEFVISSAGFWMQQAGNEWLLTKRPRLKSEHGPFAKGYVAFNVLASVVYSAAAFAKTGPDERDTRGMAASSRLDERWIGAIVLAPALLDAWRYYHPDSKWATWTSRGVKIGMVVMVAR